MSKSYMMVQCVLNRSDTILVAWIPEKFAVKGKFLKIKTCDGWSSGWKVNAVYSYSKKSVEEVEKLSSDYKYQREPYDLFTYGLYDFFD